MTTVAETALLDVLDPFVGDYGNQQQLMSAAGYAVLRGVASLRREDTEGTPELKEVWVPTEPQIETLRESVVPRLAYLSARRRLIDFTNQTEKLADLDDHQADMFTNCIGLISSTTDAEKASTCIVAPTGVGKSYLMGKFVEALHPDAQEEAPKARKTIILTSTNLLIKQIQNDIHGRLPHLGIGKYNKDSKQLEQEVTLMTYQSFIRAMSTGKIKKSDFAQVLLDEADMALAPDTRVQMKEFISQSVAVGFTATPKNGEHRNVSDLFENVIENYDTKTCIEKGKLSATQVWLVHSGESLDIGKIQRFKDIPAEKLQELGKRAGRGALSAGITRDFIDNGLKGLVRCAPGDDCAVAKERADQLNLMLTTDKDGSTRCIRAAAVGSSIKESQEIIDAYKRGEYDALCYVKMIGRGFDDADTDFFIDESPTLSPVEGTQGPGRALRYREGKIAQIVHIVDDITSEGKPLNAFTMLHVLGVDKYEPGMFFGPDDGWRGNDKRYPLKPYESLDLFSHEIANIIRTTHLRIARGYTLSPEIEQDSNVELMTAPKIAEKYGLNTNSFSTFLKNNDIQPRSIGKNRLYDARYGEVFAEMLKLSEEKVTNPESRGWVSIASLDEKLLKELALIDPFLSPVAWPIVSRGIGLRTRYLTAKQWEHAQKLFTSTITVEDEIISTFIVNGNDVSAVMSRFEDMHFINPFEAEEIQRRVVGWRRNIDNHPDPDAIPKMRESVRTLFLQSPLLQSMRESTFRLQEVFDEAQTSIGTKGRLVNNTEINRGRTPHYGFYTTMSEQAVLSSKLQEGFDTLDFFDEFRRNYDDIEPPTDIEVEYAISAINSMFNWLAGDNNIRLQDSESFSLENFYLDMFRSITDMTVKPVIILDKSFLSHSSGHDFVCKVKLEELIQRILANGQKHGIDMSQHVRFFDVKETHLRPKSLIYETKILMDGYNRNSLLRH